VKSKDYQRYYENLNFSENKNNSEIFMNSFNSSFKYLTDQIKKYFDSHSYEELMFG